MNEMNEMRVMMSDGDFKCSWDPSNPASILVASEAYATYVNQGYRAFSMTSSTEGEIMDGFDPNVASILFVPPLTGG